MFQQRRRRLVGPSIAWTALLLLASGCVPSAQAGQPPGSAVKSAEPEPVSVTVFTDRVELFMEYPRLVRGQAARFLAHVTVLATGEPVRSGRLRLELTAASGEQSVHEASAPTRDGLFIPVGAFETPGTYAARVVIDSEQVRDTVQLEPLVVHQDLESALSAADAEATEQPADTVPFLLEQQWKVGLLLDQVERRTLVQRLRVPGEIEAPQGALAVLAAPLAGRLLAPEGGALPSIGERVEAGQVLALVEPPLTASNRVQLVSIEATYRALEAEILMREFDLEAEELALEKTILQSQARLEFAGLALKRIEGLRAQDLGTVAELEAARRDVLVAQREVEGVRTLEASFEEARQRFDALLTRAEQARSEGAESGRALHPLIAPIAGRIVAVHGVVGESVGALESVFRVLDASRVWIRADLSEFELDRIERLHDGELGALLEFAAYPDRRFDVLGGMGGHVVHVGHTIDPDTRTIHLRWEAENEDALLFVGMFADVFLETGRSLEAIAVPEQAILLENGVPVAYALLGGETFQRRTLELGLRDGGMVEVLAGLEVGERVATRGANMVRMASVSPASFGEGHAH